MIDATFELPNEHRLDALDTLARARAMLDYVLYARDDAERSHEGENWVLDAIRKDIDQSRRLLAGVSRFEASNDLNELIASEMTLVSRDAHDRMDTLEARLQAMELLKNRPVADSEFA